MELFITVEQLVRGTRFEARTIRSAIQFLWFPPSWIMVRDREVLLDERIAGLLRIAELLAGDDPPDLQLVRYAAGMETARRQAMLGSFTDPDEARSNADHLNFLGEIHRWPDSALPKRAGALDARFDL